MADIKIDEIEYYTFLNTVKIFIDEFNPVEIKDNDKVKSITQYIDTYLEIRNMMSERKLYYDFYVNNRFTKPDEAHKAYQKYKVLTNKLKDKDK